MCPTSDCGHGQFKWRIFIAFDVYCSLLAFKFGVVVQCVGPRVVQMILSQGNQAGSSICFPFFGGLD